MSMQDWHAARDKARRAEKEAARRVEVAALAEKLLVASMTGYCAQPDPDVSWEDEVEVSVAFRIAEGFYAERDRRAEESSNAP